MATDPDVIRNMTVAHPEGLRNAESVDMNEEFSCPSQNVNL
jgi:hypothetical protein